MYPTSSQRKFWTFNNEQEIAELRLKHNQKFVNEHGERLGGLDVSLTFFFLANSLMQTDFYFKLYFKGRPKAAIFSKARRRTNAAEKLRIAFARILPAF